MICAFFLPPSWLELLWCSYHDLKHTHTHTFFSHLSKSTRGHCLQSFSCLTKGRKRRQLWSWVCSLVPAATFLLVLSSWTRNVSPAWFFISQVKPPLPVLCTFWVNRICIIKAKINKSKMQMKTKGGGVVLFPALGYPCVLLFKLYSHNVTCLALL